MEVESASLNDAYEWLRGDARFHNLTENQFLSVFSNASDAVKVSWLVACRDGSQSGKSPQDYLSGSGKSPQKYKSDEVADDDYSSFVDRDEADGLSEIVVTEIKKLIEVLMAPTRVERDDAGRITGTFKDLGGGGDFA